MIGQADPLQYRAIRAVANRDTAGERRLCIEQAAVQQFPFAALVTAFHDCAQIAIEKSLLVGSSRTDNRPRFAYSHCWFKVERRDGRSIMPAPRLFVSL